MDRGLRGLPQGGVLSRRRFTLAVPLLAGMPTAFAAAAPLRVGSAPLVQMGRALMGTQVDIAVVASAARGPQAAAAAVARAFSEMQRLEALMSRYRTDSDVARIDAAAGRHPVHVAPELMAVLRDARELHRASGGAFDPTVGALAAWRFGPGRHEPPAPGEIARAVRRVDGRALVLDERAGTAWLRRPGMRLDLGGVAKLPILQAGLEVLLREGFGDALVNGGGDVLVAGTRDGEPWRIGVRDPAQPERLLGVLRVQGRGVVASSGDYERGFMFEGRRLHHVLDPRTGWPTRGVHGVALLAERVEQVNGWGTALMVQGPQAAPAWARSHPGVELLVAGSDGSRWVSPGMENRLQPAAA